MRPCLDLRPARATLDARASWTFASAPLTRLKWLAGRQRSKRCRRRNRRPAEEAGLCAAVAGGRAEEPAERPRHGAAGHARLARVLHCVLVIHNQEHSKLIKTVSQKTMLDRERFYFKFWDDLRFNTTFREADPRILTNRQVQAVARLWAERKLSVATVHNYLSFLRTYAAWIGRPGMVRDVATYFGDDSHYVHRDRTANFDRSWIARSVEVEAKIAEVTAYDPWVGIQLELCYHFGLRARRPGTSGRTWRSSPATRPTRVTRSTSRTASGSCGCATAPRRPPA